MTDNQLTQLLRSLSIELSSGRDSLVFFLLRSLSHLCPFSWNNAKIHTYQQTQKIPSTACKTFPLCIFNNPLRPRSILNRMFSGRLGQGELAKEIKGGSREGELVWWSQFWLVLVFIFRVVSFSVLPAQLHILTCPCSEPCCKNPICTAIVSRIYLYDASREAVSLSFEMPALLTSVSFVLSCPKCLFMYTFAFLQAKLVFLKEKSVDWLHQGHPGEGVSDWGSDFWAPCQTSGMNLGLRNLHLLKNPRWH